MKFAQEIYANSSSAVCTWQIEFVFSNMTNIHANILEYIHFQSNIYYADIDPIHIYLTLVIWFLNFIQPVGHCVSFPFFFTLFIKHFSLSLSLFLLLFFAVLPSPVVLLKKKYIQKHETTQMQSMMMNSALDQRRLRLKPWKPLKISLLSYHAAEQRCLTVM